MKNTPENTVHQVRQDYDCLADEYARQLFKELDNKPLDRQLLDRFAAEVRNRGDVCDIGCGPGQIARYLRDAGTAVFGVDISPKMVEVARRLNPDISFREGNVLALDIPDATLEGIVAFYAIVNIPKQLLPVTFHEMRRVVKPGGLLLLSFHVGNETLRPGELWNRQISMAWFFFPVGEIRILLESARFEIEEIIERDSYAADVEHQSRRAYIFARRNPRK